jgi:S-DNA-T family DNA segregation ATPase FtsK/SpoIIIE
VVTNPKKASLALKWAVDEMERRYEVMKNAGVRDLRGYNRKAEKERAEAEAAQLRAKADAIEAATAEGDEGKVKIVGGPTDGDLPQNIPYIVVVIDEFADLMMVAGKEVEHCVARIAQKARAAGIHLILATQRPSTDVITGVIKANFPTRIAFQVSSSIDSRTILSTNGAESLLGKGDMLFMPPGTSKLTRVHGAFVTEDEIHEVVKFIGEQQEPQYLDESILDEPEESEESDGNGADNDPIYEEAIRVIARDGRASTSHLQRRLSLGYNRAARIVDQMEQDGLVGPSRGAKPRELNKSLINELLGRWDEVSYDPEMDRA